MHHIAPNILLSLPLSIGHVKSPCCFSSISLRFFDPVGEVQLLSLLLELRRGLLQVYVFIYLIKNAISILYIVLIQPQYKDETQQANQDVVDI